MGALDEANYARQEAGSINFNPLEIARTRVENAQRDLDKVLNNPKATEKQIVAASQVLSMADDILVKTLLRGQPSSTVFYSGGNVPPSGGDNQSGSGLGTSLIDTPSPTPPTLPTLPEAISPVVKPPVKTAPIDTILIDQDTINIDVMSDLIWEDIGGQELINIARNDTVNGQNISYQPIKNLTTIQQQYNPNNIVSLQNTSDKYFVNFPIKLETKLPGEGDGGGPNGAYVYIEDSTGDLIIELINLETDEQVEVQISLSGTIYEAEFNES